MIVDVHAHYFPKEYNTILMRIGGRSLREAAGPSTVRPMRADEPSGILTRLQQMDAEHQDVRPARFRARPDPRADR